MLMYSFAVNLDFLDLTLYVDAALYSFAVNIDFLDLTLYVDARVQFCS